jgi:OPT oligopeptide transporter protein
VHMALYHGKSLIVGLRKMGVENDDIHAELMRNYREVQEWWYFMVFCFFFCVAVIAVEVGFIYCSVKWLILFCRYYGIRRCLLGPCCSLYFFQLSIYYFLDSSMP